MTLIILSIIIAALVTFIIKQKNDKKALIDKINKLRSQIPNEYNKGYFAGRGK